MKYTNYIVKGNIIDINSIQSTNFYLKIPIRLVSVIVAFVGIVALGSMLPITIMADTYRNTKSVLIHFKRRGYRLQ